MFWKSLDWNSWRGTLKLRLTRCLVCGVGTILLVALAAVYATQRFYLTSRANKRIRMFATEFLYEYLCQQEEPVSGVPHPLDRLPDGCISVISATVGKPFQGVVVYYVPDTDRYCVAGICEGAPLLATYDERSRSVLSWNRIDPASALNYIDAEFNEESYGQGQHEIFLLLFSENGDVGARSEFKTKYLNAFKSLFERQPPADGVHALRWRRVSLLAHTQRLYDGNYLVVAQNISSDEANLRHLLAIFVVTFLGFLPLGTAMAVVFARRVTSGLTDVCSTAYGIAEGRLDTRVPEQSNADREVVALAHAFNHMADNTQALLCELENVTDDIAHDLRTPLTRLKSRAELELLHAENRDFAAAIAEECDDMLGTINTMLEITRIEKHFDHTKCTKTDLNALLKRLHEAFLTLAEDHRIDFTLSLPEGAPVMLECHPKQLEQMTANLIDNALKYTPDGGRVKIALRRNDIDNSAELSVSDNGYGIAQEDLPKIYDRFFRADASRSKPGNGLGLSMVKAVAESLGGRVQVDSTLGAGTTFAVRMPLGR